MQTGQKWPKQRCNTFVNPLLQDSGPTSIAIEDRPKHCNGGLTKSTPLEEEAREMK